MLTNLILFPIMLLCIRMRHLALGILHMLKCLKEKLLLHQMSLTFQTILFSKFLVLYFSYAILTLSNPIIVVKPIT
jgi:hypothetical protein